MLFEALICKTVAFSQLHREESEAGGAQWWGQLKVQSTGAFVEKCMSRRVGGGR